MSVCLCLRLYATHEPSMGCCNLCVIVQPAWAQLVWSSTTCDCFSMEYVLLYECASLTSVLFICVLLTFAYQNEL